MRCGRTLRGCGSRRARRRAGRRGRGRPCRWTAARPGPRPEVPRRAGREPSAPSGPGGRVRRGGVTGRLAVPWRTVGGTVPVVAGPGAPLPPGVRRRRASRRPICAVLAAAARSVRCPPVRCAPFWRGAVLVRAPFCGTSATVLMGTPVRHRSYGVGVGAVRRRGESGAGARRAGAWRARCRSRLHRSGPDACRAAAIRPPGRRRCARPRACHRAPGVAHPVRPPPPDRGRRPGTVARTARAARLPGRRGRRCRRAAGTGRPSCASAPCGSRSRPRSRPGRRSRRAAPGRPAGRRAGGDGPASGTRRRSGGRTADRPRRPRHRPGTPARVASGDDGTPLGRRQHGTGGRPAAFGQLAQQGVTDQ